MDDYVTIQQLSERLSVPAPTIYAWAKQGIIPTHRILDRVLVKKEDVGSIVAKYEAYKKHKLKRVK